MNWLFVTRCLLSGDLFLLSDLLHKISPHISQIESTWVWMTDEDKQSIQSWRSNVLCRGRLQTEFFLSIKKWKFLVMRITNDIKVMSLNVLKVHHHGHGDEIIQKFFVHNNKKLEDRTKNILTTPFNIWIITMNEKSLRFLSLPPLQTKSREIRTELLNIRSQMLKQTRESGWIWIKANFHYVDSIRIELQTITKKKLRLTKLNDVNQTGFRGKNHRNSQKNWKKWKLKVIGMKNCWR